MRSVIAILMREGKCGREQAQSIMRELVDAGYATRTQGHGAGGRFLTFYTVHPKPVGNPGGASGSPATGSPATVEPATASPSAVVEPQDGEPREAKTLRVVSDDQVYLAGRLHEAWPAASPLTPAGVQKLNNVYGTERVASAMRVAYGFPPGEPIRSIYAYVESICRESA